MDMQLELFGKALAAESGQSSRGNEKYRAYFTILPPPASAQDLERGAQLLARRSGARNPIRADRLHVSLNTVWRANDEPQQALLDEACEAGDAVRRPGFDIAFDKVQTWSGDSRSKTGGRSIAPTVLTCSNGAREVLALYADIRRELQRLGLPGGPKSFAPHLTVWYDHVRVPDLLLRRAFHWPVRKFWLVQTIRGQVRPDYIGEWELG